ncbi:MAG: dihydrofolate reductase [Saprospiraceae bacterium]|jgi:dihydrofolate reductase|nr:dihydrofolate reductase [Saprospiraceae bacterium]
MTVSAIVAIARNNAIGHQNQIPWYLPADLKYFKKVTTGHHVIMGRKSFESIGRPLPNRTNVVITRDPFFVATGCTVVHSLEEALSLADANGEEEAFIIGGGEIYRQSWDYLDRLYLTEVGMEPTDADVFFPKVNEEEWRETSREAHAADEKNPFPYVFRVLERA